MRKRYAIDCVRRYSRAIAAFAVVAFGMHWGVRPVMAEEKALRAGAAAVDITPLKLPVRLYPQRRQQFWLRREAIFVARRSALTTTTNERTPATNAEAIAGPTSIRGRRVGRPE